MEPLNTGVFLKVVETGSFAKAARELSYTQAGVSYIVNAMEDKLGFSLFIRDYGGVRLTEEGKELLPLVQELEKHKHLLEEKINDIHGLVCGRVKLLTFDSISIHWIPGILSRFKQEYPGVTVEITTVEDSRLAEQLILHRDADCAFFLHSPVTPELYSIPLMSEKMKAIVNRDHPLAGGGIFPVADLGKYPYIDMAFADVTGIEDIFSSRGITPHTAFCLDNDNAAMAMVSAGHGFCIFPEILLRNVPFDLVALDFDEPVNRTVSIGISSPETASRAAVRFMEVARAWVAEHEG